MATKFYDPKKNIVTVSVGNVADKNLGLPLSGWAKGDMIKITRNNDKYSGHTGVDGEDFTFVKNNDESAEITLSLMENSDVVGPLSALIKAADLTGVALSISIRNLNSGRTHFSPACMLKKDPDESLGEDSPQLDFSFLASKVETRTAQTEALSVITDVVDGLKGLV